MEREKRKHKIVLNRKLAELIGIVMGDGFLESTPNHYRIGIVGDPIKDKDYYEYVRSLIRDICAKEVRSVERARGLRITFGHKKLFTELTHLYRLPVGEGKSKKVRIPSIIAKDWRLAKHTIRGIVDTDGSIFGADKTGAPNYPSIEITTSSITLAKQLRRILLAQGFKTANIWRYQSKNSSIPSYKVPLNGYKNVRMWLEKIGFSNPTKRRKAEILLKEEKKDI